MAEKSRSNREKVAAGPDRAPAVCVGRRDGLRHVTTAWGRPTKEWDDPTVGHVPLPFRISGTPHQPNMQPNVGRPTQTWSGPTFSRLQRVACLHHFTPESPDFRASKKYQSGTTPGLWSVTGRRQRPRWWSPCLCACAQWRQCTCHVSVDVGQDETRIRLTRQMNVITVRIRRRRGRSRSSYASRWLSNHDIFPRNYVLLIDGY